MTKEQIIQLIEFLERYRLRPGMFAWGRYMLSDAWMRGFYESLSIVKGKDSEHYSAEAYQRARKDRGWTERTTNLTGYISGRLSSDDEVIDEVLLLDIKAWKDHLSSIDDMPGNESRREQVNIIIQALESVRQNPTQYMYGEKDWAPATLLAGLHEGLMLFGAIQGQAHVPLLEQVKGERGWTEDTPDIFHYLKNERGFSDEDATTELLTIEIEAWKKLLADIETAE